MKLFKNFSVNWTTQMYSVKFQKAGKRSSQATWKTCIEAVAYTQQVLVIQSLITTLNMMQMHAPPSRLSHFPNLKSKNRDFWSLVQSYLHASKLVCWIAPQEQNWKGVEVPCLSQEFYSLIITQLGWTLYLWDKLFDKGETTSQKDQIYCFPVGDILVINRS